MCFGRSEENGALAALHGLLRKVVGERNKIYIILSLEMMLFCSY